MKNRIIALVYCLLMTAMTFGQSLSLDSCLKLALENNARIQNAQWEVEAAKQVKKQAFTKYFPQISGLAGGYHAQNPLLEYGINDLENATARDLLNVFYHEYGAALGLPNSISLFEKGIGLGATAIQPVFMGGQIVNGNKLASLGVTAAELQAELAQQEVVLQTEESYWLVISLQEKRKTLAQALTLLDTLFKDVTTATEAGLVLQNDVLKVRLKQNELNSNVLKVENGLVLAMMALCQSIGIPYSDSLRLTETLDEKEEMPDTMYVNPEQVLSQRVEYRLLNLNVEAKKLQKKMTIGATLPQLLVGAGCSYGNLVRDKASYNGLAFATLQLPLTAWWETSHKLKEQEARLKQAENDYRDLSEKMDLQTRQAWNDMQETAKQVALADETVEAAAANLKIATDHYHAGLVPLSELLEAQTLHRQAVDQQSDARISHKIKAVRYRQMTGIAR